MHVEWLFQMKDGIFYVNFTSQQGKVTQTEKREQMMFFRGSRCLSSKETRKV